MRTAFGWMALLVAATGLVAAAPARGEESFSIAGGLPPGMPIPKDVKWALYGEGADYYWKANPTIRDDDLIGLAERFDAPTLDLSECKHLTDAGLTHLAPLKKTLKSLSLNANENITDDGLKHLADLDLEGLYLWGCKEIGDDGLAHLAGMANLRRLSVNDLSKLTDRSMDVIARFKQLRFLMIARCPRITPEGHLKLTELTELRQLGLKGNQVTDAVLERFAALTHLEDLYLTGCQAITDAGVTALAGLEHLKFLDIANCPAVTGAGLMALAKAPALKRINIHNQVMVDKEVDGVKKMREETPVGPVEKDVAVKFMVKAMENVKNPNITAEDLAAFAAARPQVNVQ